MKIHNEFCNVSNIHSITLLCQNKEQHLMPTSAEIILIFCDHVALVSSMYSKTVPVCSVCPRCLTHSSGVHAIQRENTHLSAETHIASPPAAPFSTLCTWSPDRELAAWITPPAVSCNALGIILRRVMSTGKVGNLQPVSSGRITFTLNSLSGRVLLGTQRLESYCQLKQLTTMCHIVLRMIPQTVSVSSFSFRGQNKLLRFMTFCFTLATLTISGFSVTEASLHVSPNDYLTPKDSASVRAFTVLGKCDFLHSQKEDECCSYWFICLKYV